MSFTELFARRDLLILFLQRIRLPDLPKVLCTCRRIRDIDRGLYLTAVLASFGKDACQNLLMAKFCEHPSRIVRRWPSDIMPYLLQTGLDVNFEDADKTTPVMWASWNGRAKEVTALIAAKASIHHQSTNNPGRTALSIATNRGRTSMVEVLRTACAQQGCTLCTDALAAQATVAQATGADGKMKAILTKLYQVPPQCRLPVGVVKTAGQPYEVRIKVWKRD